MTCSLIHPLIEESTSFHRVQSPGPIHFPLVHVSSLKLDGCQMYPVVVANYLFLTQQPTLYTSLSTSGCPPFRVPANVLRDSETLMIVAFCWSQLITDNVLVVPRGRCNLRQTQ